MIKTIQEVSNKSALKSRRLAERREEALDKKNLRGIDTMASNKKITKRDRFNALLSLSEVQANAELVAFIEHEIELLDKKNSSEKKPTAQQTANESIKAAIVAGMTPNRLYTVSEIQKEISECAELSNQRISALLRQMIGKEIVRTEDKRKAYFSLAE